MKKFVLFGMLLAIFLVASCVNPVNNGERIAPAVISTNPTDGATAVARNRNITATFSEEMNSATITPASFILQQGTSSIIGVVSYAGSLAIFNPASDLVANTTYKATIYTDVTDLVGNALPAIESYQPTNATDLGGEPLVPAKEWTFTTSAVLDSIAPLVAFTTPANGATSVTRNSNITATFSEEMDPTTILSSTFTLKQGTTSIAGVVSHAGLVATFNPTSDLAASTSYTAMITTGVKDMTGNALAANKEWTFTTSAVLDSATPIVTSTTPADEAISVTRNSHITATFSEEMDSTTINTANFTLKQGTTAITGVVSYAGLVATFNPTSDLAASTVYNATITIGAKDLAGNALAANKEWSFTTSAALDSTAPLVSSKTPADGATSVARNTNLTATFSEEMDFTTITNANFTLKQGITAISGVVSYAGLVATFNPEVDLAASTVYEATITTGTKDIAGNALAANKVWSFTTSVALDTTAPTVTAMNPADLATAVATNSNITATFSEEMDPITITTANFTLKQGAASITGIVSYAGSVATFDPASNLASNTTYDATITTSVKDLAGNALAVNKVWSFTTSTIIAAGPAAVNLRTAGDFVILAKAAVSTTGTTAVTGDIGISPAARSYLTGFSEALDSSNEFATSSLVTGRLYAANMAPPTPAKMTAAISDMETAYTDAAGRAIPDFVEFGSGEIGGLTLVPGLYKWGTDVLITLDVTLNGGPEDVWIFQISGGITQASGKRVILTGGALPKNIFWQTFGAVSLGTTAHLEGVVLSYTQIVLATGATVTGRLLSQTAVTMDANAVTEPSL